MFRTTAAGRRPARIATLAVAVALCASLTSCGNRNPEVEVAAAAGVGAGQSPVQTPDGTATVTGDPGAVPNAGSPVAPGSTGETVAIVPGATSAGSAAQAQSTQGAGGSTPKQPNGASSGGTSQAAAPKVANLSPVNAGIVGTFSGPIGQLVNGTVIGARVWAKWQNDHGGVNGHPINVLVGDDGGDPARYNSLVKEFVETRNVIGFIETTLGFAPAGNNEYLNSKKVVTFSSEGGSNQAYENPYFVTAFAAGDVYARAFVETIASVAIPAGKTKVGSIACSDFSICDLFYEKWKNPDYMKSVGMEPVFGARPSLTQPDYTATCLAAKQAGAQTLILALDSASIERFAGDCARQNYRPLLGTGDIVVNASLPKAPIVDGLVVATKIAPWTATSVPGVQTFISALKQYAGLDPDGSTELGWAAGAFFGAAARNLPATNPTAADVFKGLYSLKGETLGGMTYPLDFTKGKTAPKIVCYGMVTIKDGKFTQGPGPALICPKN